VSLIDVLLTEVLPCQLFNTVGEFEITPTHIVFTTVLLKVQLKVKVTYQQEVKTIGLRLLGKKLHH
jgi:hypothetical protein